VSLAKRVAERFEKERLQELARLLAQGLSDRKILDAMGITLNEAHALTQELRRLHGLSPMVNLRKTLKNLHE
jgi:hypothetical protein